MEYKFKAQYLGLPTEYCNFSRDTVYDIEINVDKEYLEIKTSTQGHCENPVKAIYQQWSWKAIMIYWKFDFKNLFEEVLLERVRQDYKFGKRTQHSMIWHTILSEETGEVAREICDSGFAWKPAENYRKELIEAAAVAIAAVQDYDLSGEYGRADDL